MGPKIKFTKEQIIDAAFELAQEKGLENVTLRKVAEKLGCSVAPIYVNFEDADDLLKEVVLKAQKIIIGMTSVAYTDMPFLNIGIGTLRFAREYSTFYNSQWFMDASLQNNMNAEVIMLELMKKDDMLIGFSDQELREMLLKMSIFTHGLASMASRHILPPQYDEPMLIELMTRTGDDIIMATRIKKEAFNHEIDNH